MNAKLVTAIIAIATFSTAAVAAPAQDEVGFEDYSGVTASGAVVQGATAYQGPYRKPLTDADFYRAVGRDDLAAQYEANVKGDHVVGALGAGAIVAGLAGGAAMAVSSCERGGQPDCATGGGLVASLGLGAGILLISAAIAHDDNPVDLPARRQLADEHNQSLQLQLAPNGLQMSF